MKRKDQIEDNYPKILNWENNNKRGRAKRKICLFVEFILENKNNREQIFALVTLNSWTPEAGR